MPIPTADEGTLRRERRRLLTRREMAKVAVRLFTEKGYAATSAGEIANAANYSERTFFRHFARKEDVVFYDHPERLHSMQLKFANQPHESAWEVVRDALIANAREWEQSDPELTRARIRLFYSEPVLLARYLEITMEWENAVSELAARETGADPESDVRARLVATTTIGAFRAASRAWLAAPNQPLADHIRSTFDLIESGSVIPHPRPSTTSSH